eukprot:scaffold848_cov120-Amphora_coffeaeformis.AAC.5
MELLVGRAKKYPDKTPRSHCFNSYFYPLLMGQGQGIEHSRVHRWTKKIQGSIFDAFDLVFVPVNKNNVHWALLVIDMEKQEITGYDSLGWSCRKYLKNLNKYLEEEHMVKKGKSLPKGWKITDTTIDKNLPRQDNGFDCGVFVCMYAYYLSMGASPYTEENDPIFDQTIINESYIRAKIGLSILKGEVL